MLLREAIVRHLAFPITSIIEVRRLVTSCDYALHLEHEYKRHVLQQLKL